MARRMTLVCAAAIGYGFLYLPMLVLFAYSFNSSERVMVWQDFSVRWYWAALRNTEMLDALQLSAGVAFVNATVATALATLAGYAVARLPRFRGRGLLGGMLAAPLVVPEVVIGLSLLLLFVALEGTLGWPAARGATTVAIAHITFSIAYVTLVIQAWLARLDPALEEAALDLGATPGRAFATVILPMMAPALGAGWLLAFTLSLDDLVVASFVTGPGASTLPIVVFSKVRLGLSPEINALATLLFTGVFTVVLLAAILRMWVRRPRRPLPSQGSGRQEAGPERKVRF